MLRDVKVCTNIHAKMQIHIDVCSKMKQFRHKLAQRKGKLGFCREFAPIKWGGVTL